MANFQNEREQLGQLEWLFQQKKFAEGLARVEPILIEFPASFHLKFLKFKFLRELRQNGEALQLLRQMHAMSGENIMVVKELADLTFQLKQFPESLLFYKKLLFLDSFNVQAQERVKLIQGMLAGGVADRLADTKAEFRPDVATFRPQPAAARPSAAAVEPKQITFDRADVVPASGDVAPQKGDMAPVPPAMNVSPSEAEDPHFQTESAAELYFKQGLYREALAVYKNLFEKTGRTDHFLKVKAILLLLRTDRSNRVIERLQNFMHLLQQRGSQIV
ncbi:MAG: hypothetical protein PHX05_03710 [Acidobacteriota bacterium]|nr:hypothetical protein [Acidobacteriota bacterium]